VIVDKTARILWVVKNFPPSMGGVQQYVYNYAYNTPNGRCVILTRKQGDEKKAKEIDSRLAQKSHVVIGVDTIPEELGVLSIVHYPFRFFSFITLKCTPLSRQKIALFKV